MNTDKQVSLLYADLHFFEYYKKRHKSRRGLFGRGRPVGGGQERVMEVFMIKVLYVHV
jgi:hypothetical protein